MNARRMEYGPVDLIVDGDDYVAMKRENARLTAENARLAGQVASLREALAGALDDLSQGEPLVADATIRAALAAAGGKE